MTGGRGWAVLSPLMQLAEIVAMILAGALASTVLRGVHFAVGGLQFGPYDTVFAVGGLLFLIGGLSAIAPMRRTGRAAAGEPAAADEPLAADQPAASDRQEPDTVAVDEPVPPANEATTAEADAGGGTAVAASD